MKKITLLVAVSVALFSCQSAPKADEAKTGDEQAVAAAEGTAYKVDSTQVVNFIGTKPVGQHSGSFNIAEGSIFVKDSSLSGKLVLAINSLKITDKDTSGASKLAGHLASPDFFDAAQFPTATFEVTGVQKFVADSTQKLLLTGATHTIQGNLTLKGVTKNVSFPAIVSIADNAVKVQANFNIDRTNWGLVYGNDKSLGDKFINPEVNISFDVTAVK